MMRTSLTHSEGWKWTPPPRLIQRLRAEDLGADELTATRATMLMP